MNMGGPLREGQSLALQRPFPRESSGFDKIWQVKMRTASHLERRSNHISSVMSVRFFEETLGISMASTSSCQGRLTLVEDAIYASNVKVA